MGARHATCMPKVTCVFPLFKIAPPLLYCAKAKHDEKQKVILIDPKTSIPIVIKLKVNFFLLRNLSSNELGALFNFA